MAITNIMMFIRIMNIVTGGFLIFISVFSILNIAGWLTFKVFLIPCPFFIGIFGIVLLGLELRIQIILKKLQILKSVFARGIFNIYLSSLAFWFLEDSQILVWVSALSLFISGIIYIALHFGWSKELQKQYEEEEERLKRKQILKKSGDNGSPNVRQNLI